MDSIWNYQTLYNSGIRYVIYILLLLQCPSVATLGHFEQSAFLEVMALFSISRLAEWCFVTTLGLVVKDWVQIFAFFENFDLFMFARRWDI